jgi:site-specific DNA recombinase
LKRSAEGMNRAAREGRYTGGIVPLGYKLEERNKHFFYVPSDVPMWNGLTEADVARRIFQRLGRDGWSCAQVAMEFHTLGIPTVYQKDRRGIRGKATQAVWRTNRIYGLATNTIYRGEMRYGLHTKRPGGREIISAEVPRLVSDELWHAAQESLHANRVNPTGKTTIYFLRSLMSCDLCGRRYMGASSVGRKGQYRCGGQLNKKIGVDRCQGKTIRCDAIDDPIRTDIERWLRDPGDILNELAQEASDAAGAGAVAEAERVLYEGALRDLEQQRRRAQNLHIRGGMSAVEFDDALERIETERRFVLQKLEVFGTLTAPSVDIDLLAEIRAKLDTGLSAAQWQQLAGLLVTEVRVKTEVVTLRAKRATATVHYRFPCVVGSHTGSRSPRSRSSPLWRRNWGS